MLLEPTIDVLVHILLTPTRVCVGQKQFLDLEVDCMSSGISAFQEDEGL